MDSFSARIKPEAKDVAEEEEEEGIGDVDLFTLTEGGSALTVNAKWLQHLQACAWRPHGLVYDLAWRASNGGWC